MHRSLLTRHLPLLFCALIASNLAAEPFSVGTRTDTIPERGEVTYNVVRTARNEFSFLPPSGWKAETDAKAGAITWTSSDYRSTIRLKIADDNGDQTPKLQTEELRQIVATELPDAKITEELPCYTSGASGMAFDSERVIENKFHVTIRIAFIPVSGGTIQFQLSSPKEMFAAKEREFSRFLNSFRAAKIAPK